MSALELERRGSVALLTLNRPSKANALNVELLTALVDAQTEIQADDSIGAVVITGNGRHFSAGADLSDEAVLPAGVGIGFDVLDRPIIAAVNGTAVGGGLELALACDFRFASANATFGLPEILFGELPAGGGTMRLARLVGIPAAKRLVMTGGRITAEDARAIGLVDQVVEPDGVLESALDFAKQLAARPAYAIRAAKLLIDSSQDLDLASGLRMEQQVTRTMATPSEREHARQRAAADDPAYARIFERESR